jgi:hypothetical protein
MICLLLMACDKPLTDDELIAAFPKSMRIPSCMSLDRESGSGGHYRDDEGYEDTVYLAGDRECLDRWSEEFGKSRTDRGPLYFRRDHNGYVMVVRVIEKYAPAGDRAFVQWLHDKPIESVDYWDMRD